MGAALDPVPAAAAASASDQLGADGGEVLRVAFTSDPITLDPHKSTTIWEFLTQPLLHLTLLDIHGTTHLEPRGAASWTSSPDGRHFTFRLRRGLTFSNGRPVVAADYVYGLERILSPATATFFQGSLLGVKGSRAFIEGTSPHVDGLKAPAPDLLVIELDQGDPMFSCQLAQLAYPLPREVVDRDPKGFGRQPVGAGPYRFARWDRGARLRLERRPDYRGPDPALVDAVDIFIGSDATTHLMMFEQGEIDIANVVSQSLPFPSYRRVSTDPHWKDLIQIQPGLSTEFLAMNLGIPPFDNVLVRRAVNHAIDRRRRMRIDLGYSRHAEGAIPSGMPAADPGLKGYDHDPARARELLRQSGLPLPLRTTLWYQTGEEMKVAGEGFQWDLKQVGIEAELREVSSAQLWSASTTRGQVPITFAGWTCGIPDPVDILGMTLDGSSIGHPAHNNQAFYHNPAVNRLLHEAAVEIDLPRRHRLYREAERMIVADAPWVFLGHYNQYGLRQPWIRGRLMEPLAPYRFDRLSIAR